MSEYVRQIVATTLLVIVISMLLPEGKMGKVIKSFFPLIISLVIITPVFSLLKFDYQNIFNDNGSSVTYQSTFLDYVKNEKIEQVKLRGQDILYENGIQSAVVTIQYNDGENLDFEITKITVNLLNAVIKWDDENIDIIEKVKQIISSGLGVEKRMVEVYGK